MAPLALFSQNMSLKTKTCMSVWTYFLCLFCPRPGPCQRRWRHLHGLLVTSEQSFSVGCQTRKEPHVATLISIPHLGGHWDVSNNFQLSLVERVPQASPYLL